MKTATVEEIMDIVPPEYVLDWSLLEPVVFYKNNKPYGLIAEHEGLVASTTSSPELHFTIEMLQYLYAINEKMDITLITDQPEYFKHITALLEPRGFTCSIENDILFSRREKNA
jgi:hypothetical protein